MAGVLPQTNGTLLGVSSAPLLSDSFAVAPAGSGESTSSVSKWEGKCGIWVAQPRERRESSTDGRDVLRELRVFCPVVCEIEIGDELEVLWGHDVPELWRVSGVARIGQGVEVGASQTYELEIEVT